MYATDVAREVQENYIDKGLLKLVYWDLPLSSHGYPAIMGSEASHCAGDQGVYWEMHEKLFESWREMSDLDVEDEEAATAFVVELGDGIVADHATYTACVETNKYRPVVATLLRQALDMEVNVTPAFLIQTTDPAGNQHVEPMMGFLEYEEFSELLDQEISRSQGTPIPTRTPLPPTPVPDAEEGAEGEDAGSDAASDEASDDDSSGDEG